MRVGNQGFTGTSLSSLAQGVRDQIAWHLGGGYPSPGGGGAAAGAGTRPPVARMPRGLRRLGRPRPQIDVEPDAMHVVVERLAQAASQEIVIGSGGILEGDLVAREAGRLRQEADAEPFGVKADRAVGGGGEPVPERRLDAPLREQLPDPLQRVDRFLLGLGGKTVH